MSQKWDGVSELAVVRRIDVMGARAIAVVWADPGKTLCATVLDLTTGWRRLGYTTEVVPMPQAEIVRRFRALWPERCA
jgi:hypothetical protein